MVEFRANYDRFAVIGLDCHIVQPHRCGCRRRAGHDLIGAFVDDAQAMIFDHRHPVGQRQGRATREDLEAEPRRIVLTVDAVDRHRHRTSCGELFYGGDIGDRLRGAEGFCIAAREGQRITVSEHAGSHAVGGGGECGFQLVAPGRGDGADLGFQSVARDDRRFAFIAPDDVVDARKRSFGEGGVGG
jgi:hypothetical protein